MYTSVLYVQSMPVCPPLTLLLCSSASFILSRPRSSRLPRSSICGPKLWPPLPRRPLGFSSRTRLGGAAAARTPPPVTRMTLSWCRLTSPVRKLVFMKSPPKCQTQLCTVPALAPAPLDEVFEVGVYIFFIDWLYVAFAAFHKLFFVE